MAVEILSPSETPRAIQRKVEEYLAAGVPEVWSWTPHAPGLDVRPRRIRPSSPPERKFGHVFGVHAACDSRSCWSERLSS
jgi:hypothetical protein